MLKPVGRVVAVIAAVTTSMVFSACAAKTAKKDRVRPTPLSGGETYLPSPVPTVPPPGSTLAPTAPPTPQRKAKPGEPLGPDITFFGITRADGKNIDPEPDDKSGIPTFKNFVGSGFQLVVEAKPGLSGYDVNRRLFAQSPDDPKMRPDLEIMVSRPLGDGSTEVCDKLRPNIGGVPAINPPSFAETRKISDTINDLACRFETFIETDSACTLSKNEDWAFKRPDTKVQFCSMVAKAWNFPIGETLVTVRLRDTAGNPGPIKQMKVLRPQAAPVVKKPQPNPAPPTPKALPTR